MAIFKHDDIKNMLNTWGKGKSDSAEMYVEWRKDCLKYMLDMEEKDKCLILRLLEVVYFRCIDGNDSVQPYTFLNIPFACSEVLDGGIVVQMYFATLLLVEEKNWNLDEVDFTEIYKVYGGESFYGLSNEALKQNFLEVQKFINYLSDLADKNSEIIKKYYVIPGFEEAYEHIINPMMVYVNRAYSELGDKVYKISKELIRRRREYDEVFSTPDGQLELTRLLFLGENPYEMFEGLYVTDIQLNDWPNDYGLEKKILLGRQERLFFNRKNCYLESNKDFYESIWLEIQEETNSKNNRDKGR